MNLRHKSSAKGVIMLEGENLHLWSPTKGVNPIPASITVDQKQHKSNQQTTHTSLNTT